MASITLRPASLNDGPFLYDLRTDPAVAAASARPIPLDLDTHIGWLTRALQNPDVHLFIVEDGVTAVGRTFVDFADERIGQCRLDAAGAGGAEVSIALTRLARGHGIGTEVLQLLARRAKDLGFAWLEAVIKEDNLPSRKAFLKAGYSVEEIKDGWVHMGLYLQ